MPSATTALIDPPRTNIDSPRTNDALLTAARPTGIHRTGTASPVQRVTVAVYAPDPILYVGVVHQLRQRPEIEL
ncbi:hypothetical protein ABT160_33060, partial [Streptomyces sp. NPDC001941]